MRSSCCLSVCLSVCRSQMETLLSSYSTVKKGDGLRLPSYTDRCLYHSLPDSAARLHLLHYAMCDEIVGSDHRPVTAAFALHVNPKVGADALMMVILLCGRFIWCLAFFSSDMA